MSREWIILYVELALRSKKRDEQAERVLNFLYDHTKWEDQFYWRALLATSIIEFRKVDKAGLKAEDNLKQTMKAWEFIEKAFAIITRPENKLRYEFLIYNAALVTYQVLRPLNKPGWAKNFIAIIEKISNLLEEKDDADFNLRIRYLSWLSNCYLDAEKKPEGLKFHDKLYDLTKKVKECSFQEVIFRNRLHIYRDNNGQLAAMKKDAETGADPKNLKALCVIQQIKSGVIPENQIEKELTTVMAALSPAAVSLAAGNSGEANQASVNKKLSKFDQDRMAEAGRMAIKYNLVALWEGSWNVIARSTQGSLRAKIWTEYNKAELTLKKTTKVVDPLTGMKLSLEQQMEEEFERRIEALKILERAMITNKRLMDADIIIEGCVLIWNTSIPLLKPSTRSHVYKPFTAASNMLETIQANESKLRVWFYLELAKFEIEQDFISKAEEQISKAMLIDYSIARDKLQIQLNPDEEPGNFQREYERVLKRMKKSIDLRLNIYGEPESEIEQMILGVEKAKSTNNIYLRETLIDKVLKQLKEHVNTPYEITEETKTLNEEEKEKKETDFKKKLLTEKKQMILLSGEIANLAFDQNLIDLAFEAGNLCIKDEWDPHKDTDLVISQCKTQYIIAQWYVEMLLEEEIEIGFNDLITIAEDQDEREFTEEDNKKYQGCRDATWRRNRNRI